MASNSLPSSLDRISFVARARWLTLGAGVFALASLAACSSGSPSTSALDNSGKASGNSPSSTYADDASVSSTATPVGTSAPSTVDAGTFDSGVNAVDAGSDAQAVASCISLALCCAQPKACDDETNACNAVVQANDASQCSAVLTSYQKIGCGHDDSVPSPPLPSFDGCDGSGDGGILSWLGL